jgi:cytochrome c-type biogenesis protein CcmH/NrfF
VIFCDLVGSTGMAAKLDAEEWRDLVGAYLDARPRVTPAGTTAWRQLAPIRSAQASHSLERCRKLAPRLTCQWCLAISVFDSETDIVPQLTIVAWW